jgi:hypothetical protein
MEDLVERLEKSADECEYTTRSRLLREAAAEIRSLRLKDSQLANCHREIFKLREQMLSYAGLATEGPKSHTS